MRQILEELERQVGLDANMECIAGSLLKYSMQIMKSDFASLQLLDETRGGLILISQMNFHPDSERFWYIVFSGAGSACGEALRKKTRVTVQDVDQEEFMAGTGDLYSCHHSGIRSVQSTPLVSQQGEIIGMLSTHWRVPHDFANDDFESFDILAAFAANLFAGVKVDFPVRD